MKMELPTSRTLGTKTQVGLWTYSERRCWLLCMPNRATQEVPRSLSYQTSDTCVSWGPPRVTVRGDTLTAFIPSVSDCIQMEDIMASATSTEYRDKKIVLWKQHINSTLNPVLEFAKWKTLPGKKPEMVGLVSFSHWPPKFRVSFQSHNAPKTQRLLLWDKRWCFLICHLMSFLIYETVVFSVS